MDNNKGFPSFFYFLANLPTQILPESAADKDLFKLFLRNCFPLVLHPIFKSRRRPLHSIGQSSYRTTARNGAAKYSFSAYAAPLVAGARQPGWRRSDEPAVLQQRRIAGPRTSGKAILLWNGEGEEGEGCHGAAVKPAGLRGIIRPADRGATPSLSWRLCCYQPAAQPHFVCSLPQLVGVSDVIIKSTVEVRRLGPLHSVM